MDHLGGHLASITSKEKQRAALKVMKIDDGHGCIRMVMVMMRMVVVVVVVVVVIMMRMCCSEGDEESASERRHGPLRLARRI